jgi:NagD protein
MEKRKMNRADKTAYLRSKKGFICDMDGVIYHGNQVLPGVVDFFEWLQKEDIKFLFLTNSSERTPTDLRQKLLRMGLDVDESHFYTSALATASFLANQTPEASVFVIGSAGLTHALYDAGLSMNDVNPDYVVLGDTRTYNFELIEHAVHLVHSGAKLIGTNYDLTGPTEKGIVPSVRALIAPIEFATKRDAYFVGKPNPIMMREGLKRLGVDNDDAAIIGDRMDTDIVSGLEAGIDTVLVLSGVTREKDLRKFAYQPDFIIDGVGDILC